MTALGKKKSIFDIDCVDPLGRSGLVIAIENENIELIQYLLESGINPKVSFFATGQIRALKSVDMCFAFTPTDGVARIFPITRMLQPGIKLMSAQLQPLF